MRSQCLATTKSRFFDFTQIAIWGGPEAENKLRVPCEPLKNRFLDLHKVAFWNGQEAEKLVQSDMGALETSLSRLHPSRILAWSVGRK